MKSLFVALVALLSLSAHSLFAQNFSDATLNINSNYTSDNTGTLTLNLPQQHSAPPIAIGATAKLDSAFVANFVSAPSYESKYAIGADENISGTFQNDYNTEVDVGGNDVADSSSQSLASSL